MNTIEQTNKTITLSDGRILGYAEYGDVKGKPLFFFHGWPSSRLQGKIFNETARKLHIRVISIDRPGYGLSTFKQNRTLLDLPDDVVEVADSLKIKKFAVVGVSGGGPYAAACAYKIPEPLRQVGIVVGLAPTNIAGVLDGIAFVNKIAWYSNHKIPFLMQVSSSFQWLEAKKYLPHIFSFAYQAKEDKKIIASQGLQEAMDENRKEAFRQGKKGAAKDLELYTNNWGFRLEDVKAKVHLWYGTADKQVSVAMGKYYASHIPNSTLVMYPNEGHLLVKTHAGEILKTLVA